MPGWNCEALRAEIRWSRGRFGKGLRSRPSSKFAVTWAIGICDGRVLCCAAL